MMQDMIIKPANCAGLKVSDSLARHIVNDTRQSRPTSASRFRS